MRTHFRVHAQPDQTALTGYGGADKGQMQRVVAAHLHLPKPPRPDDAADALGVALCHAFTSGFGVLFGVK